MPKIFESLPPNSSTLFAPNRNFIIKQHPSNFVEIEINASTSQFGAHILAPAAFSRVGGRKFLIIRGISIKCHRVALSHRSSLGYSNNTY